MLFRSDVTVKVGGDSIDGKSVYLNHTFLYRLDSSILPPDRAYQTVTDWGGTDQLNTEYDQYLGNWAVYASRDLYRDGQMLAAKGEKIAGSGFDSSKFGGNLFTVDADDNGKVTADATQTYLDLVSADNEHEAGWVLYLQCKRIAVADEVPNTWTETINGQPRESNKVVTKTPDMTPSIHLEKVDTPTLKQEGQEQADRDDPKQALKMDADSIGITFIITNTSKTDPATGDGAWFKASDLDLADSTIVGDAHVDMDSLAYPADWDTLPLKPGEVGIYVCGATVQSSPHIGHIRAAVAFDIVRRWFLKLGYKVTFVRNVTDIDDKILVKAAAAGQRWWARAYYYEREFTEAYNTLGVLPPTVEPRATGHMSDMIDLIQRILDNGHGYVVTDADGKPTGNVYFDVASWPHYGELTHQKQTSEVDEAAAVADRMGPSVDATGADKYNPVDPADASPDKHDPRDFALWKAPKDTDPEDARWSTPFGVGRPGWHIECSAMSHRYLGDGFDIHGGGLDLRFPHHENEMAQTRAAGYPSAARWMHSAWVTAKGEKMSKSLGTGLSVPNPNGGVETKTRAEQRAKAAQERKKKQIIIAPPGLPDICPAKAVAGI